MLDSWSHYRINLADAMSGPGKLGREINQRFSHEKSEGKHGAKSLSVFFNDVREEPLSGLKDDGFQTTCCDVRELGDKEKRIYHVAAVRFGLKDLPEGQTEFALQSLSRALVPGGRLVIADMYAPSKETQAAVIEVHSRKQELAGRDPEKEGICFVPTENQWAGMLSKAGFFPVRVTYRGTSDVETSQWEGQFGPEADDKLMIEQMNRTIRQACNDCPAFAEEFKVRFERERVTLSFPIIVIAADRI